MRGKRFFAKHKPESLLFGYILFCLLALGFSTKNLILKPKELGLSVFALFQRGSSAVTSFFVETAGSIRVLGRLKQDYAAALERLEHYERIEKDLQHLEEENRSLKEVLAFSRGLEYRNIPARVIGKDPQNYHSTITVNKGSAAGIRKNMPVVAIQEGRQGLVGKVADVGLTASTIRPLQDPGSFVAARLLQSRYEGLVNGVGDDTILMRYVRRYVRANIRYGDLVVTSGMNSLFPPGIYIGSVKTIHARDYDTSLELEIEPIIDFARLEYVYILWSEEK